MSSSSSVHAPHTPCSQPRWVPVKSRPSRKNQQDGCAAQRGIDGARVHGERIMVTWRPQRWHGAAPRHECAGRSRPRRPLHQDRVGYSRIELPGEVAGDMPAKKRRGIANNDRGSIHGADDARAVAHCGSISTAAIAWANSPVLRQALTYPICRRRHGRNAHGLDDLAGLQRDSSAPVIKSSMARLRVPAGLRSVTFAPSAANAEIQSAAGSA